MGNSAGDRIDTVRAIHRELTDHGPDARDPVCLRDSAGSVPLPGPAAAPVMPLGEALLERRSRYAFGPLDTGSLSSLLRWALGPQRTVTAVDGRKHSLNLHPSAGGLQSISAYVVVLQGIDDVSAGMYRFDRVRHQLLRRRTGDVAGALSQCLVQPEFTERAPVLMVLAGELDATLGKYSERHYRTLHVDAGVAAANLYLVATALDLACCAISGFYDEKVAEALSLSDSQIPLLAFAVGGRREVRETG